MNKELTDANPLLTTSASKPNIGEMFEEYTRAGGIASTSIQRERNDNIRFTRWAGRSPDFKKWRKRLGRDPVPYDGAWDSRVTVVEDIMEDLGDILSSSFKRAQLKAKPTEARDIGKARSVELVLNHVVDQMRPQLNVEAELLWNFGLGYGGSVWQVTWDRRIAMKMQPVSLDFFVGAAEETRKMLKQLAASGEIGQLTDEQRQRLQKMIDLPGQFMDPDQEEEMAEFIQKFAAQLAGNLFKTFVTQYGDHTILNYNISLGEARRIVREMREGKQSEIPTPYLANNGPCVVAREVGVDYLAPPEMTNIQDSPWHMVREWLTPETILENKITDGWDADWCEAAIKTKGMTSIWGTEVEINQVDAEDDETRMFAHSIFDSKSGLVEVVHFFKRYVTEEGIPQIWCTVWCPHVLNDDKTSGETWALHYPLGQAHYPFVDYRWRVKKRNFHQTQGIPEILGSDQQLIKRTIDQVVDYGDTVINPPWLVRNRQGMKWKGPSPGGQVPFTREGDTKRLELGGGRPDLGFQIAEFTWARLSNKFGLMNEHVLPPKWQMKLQALVERYLASCSAMFTQMFKLVQANISPQELQMISADQNQFPTDPKEIEGSYDVKLFFDVKDLDMEFVFKKIEAFTKLAVPLDRAGVIDMSALVKLIIMAIDPTYAQVIVSEKEGASDLLKKEVKAELAAMYSGFSPEMVQNDPTASTKLEMVQQLLMGNPKADPPIPPNFEMLEALGMVPMGRPDKLKPGFKERFDDYLKHLKFTAGQMEIQPTTGRLGVAPGAPALPEMSEQMMG